MVNKGLGKGLGALLFDSEEEYDNAYPDKGSKTENQATEISIQKIEPNVNQPRKQFDEIAMGELVNSIRVHGVISPIIVIPHMDGFMIIAGERRWRAAKKAGLLTIPAIVRNYTQKQVKEISLIENLQREDLNPIETASAVKELMDDYRYTQEEVADRIGKSRPAVANLLRLLSLSKPVIQLVEAGKLSAGHAKCLVVVEDAEAQLALALKGSDDKMSVREFEKLVKAFLNPQKKPTPIPNQSLELKDLIDRMQRCFATKVSALGSDRKGRIYIDYFSRDDLDRIAQLIELMESAGK